MPIVRGEQVELEILFGLSCATCLREIITRSRMSHWGIRDLSKQSTKDVAQQCARERLPVFAAGCYPDDDCGKNRSD
jgi:hypothetical protein